MGKVFEAKEYILRFYAKYSRYIDMSLRFLLALFTFTFVSNYAGFLPSLANPAVTVGISVICTFLPMPMTPVLATVMVLIQFFDLAPGAAIVFGIYTIIMFSLFFRFSPGKSVVLLLTPISFMVKVPVLMPIVFGLVGGPATAVPMVLGVVVYFMIAYVKSYATVIETMAESGVMSQITTFTQQLFSNKEMWMVIISFTICLLLVYNIKCLSVDHAWDIAVIAGVLVNIIMMTFGHVIMDINIAYVELIVGSVIAIIVALISQVFVFAVDYSRSEYLQFEDDEYYYYVKAVPKVSVAVPEKTVKKINVRQETEVLDLKEIERTLTESMTNEVDAERKRKKVEEEESEIQKIIEEELRK